MEDMESGSFKQAMHSINYGHVMQAAARDYANEMLASEKDARERERRRGVVDANALCEVREDDEDARGVCDGVASFVRVSVSVSWGVVFDSVRAR